MFLFCPHLKIAIKSQRFVLPVDHGNQQIKTCKHVFPANHKNGGHSSAPDAEVVTYDEQDYVLSDQPAPQRLDKTIDLFYFILTLFAIGREIISGVRGFAGMEPDEVFEIVLLVGLPPLHYRSMKQRFADYFMRDEIVRFLYNGLPINFRISEVHVYPQTYAAAKLVSDEYKDAKTVNIVDIGGYTADILLIVDSQLKSSTSLYEGVNVLFRNINKQVRAMGLDNILSSTIEGVLLDDDRDMAECAPEHVGVIQSTAAEFVADLLLTISQDGYNLAANKTVFVGGGSVLLRKYMEESGMVAKPIFVDNINANAQGYQLLYESLNSASKKQGA